MCSATGFPAGVVVVQLSVTLPPGCGDFLQLAAIAGSANFATRAPAAPVRAGFAVVVVAVDAAPVVVVELVVAVVAAPVVAVELVVAVFGTVSVGTLAPSVEPGFEEPDPRVAR
jgi:hypothetical protein